LMLPVTMASDCGNTEDPIYFIIDTVFVRLSTEGRPITFGFNGIQVVGQHVRDRPDLGVVKGTGTNFGFTTDGAFTTIRNGRAAADWRLGEANGPCGGQSVEAPIKQKQTVPLTCNQLNRVIFPFQAAPDEINLQSPPATVSITGTGMDTTYGMPVIDYYDPNGNLVARTSANQVSWDGTWLTTSTPDLSQAGTGSFLLFVNNVNADGTVSYVGSLGVLVFLPEPPPPPPPDPEPCNPYCMVY